MHTHDIQPDSPTLRIAPLEHDSDIDDFFAAMARATMAGDAKAARGIWGLPGLQASEEGMRTVGSESEVLRSFAEAKERASTRGAAGLRAEIKRVQWLAESLALVEVRWLFIGSRGEEVDDDSSTFVVHRDEEGSLRIHVALLHRKKRLFH